ncbi:glycogen/starch synthase, ADP-glucose type [Leptothrix cholodnii SP-6]|uniref:Glycogen synthase n=1 Tax=Leptothrix cholodnii (strain ATCC 51168 / LMG 8142 / SP-6) TaxID=395495 RepID=GLGA_LEPCP|nr:glycogen synthase GlgA [Leptothrix cholodnii]B1Y0P9.1 RecName: Full=Glycogen synthase; AltName: Full=Starch [bacterial glycogen] synthase [Leptothrix cholodnii SP-6]ACB34157.1 glycogen/starch synthase, ADP-glucose type [Leptothrix cholodnii SP-6]
MRILQACAEIFPLLKTGGLADVAGALPPALRALGAEVRVVVPGFPAILAGLVDAIEVARLEPPPAMVMARGARLLYGRLPACDVDAYVINSPDHYHRDGGPYNDARQHPYDDNHLRFGLLGWVAAKLADGLDPYWAPRVVHAHDWHAALAPAYLRALEWARGRRLAGSVYTVHNLAYQGFFPAHHFGDLGLPAAYNQVHGLEFYGQISFMKGGLYFADRITTVSPTYAREIQGAEQGCGLDGLLRDRDADLSGILNGVDDAVWNPAGDALIPATYTRRKLTGKAQCKATLQAELGLAEDPAVPLLCVVSRLTEQKGLHLVLQALPALIERGFQFALLGSGDAGMENEFRRLAEQHPTAAAVRLGYDEAFAHRLIAGSDLILVPSRFEPCGLTQLYGLKYGTLPVVRRVGGLVDTVADARLETLDHDATGFVFDDFSADGLIGACLRAKALFRRRADWLQVQRRGMQQPFGWEDSARQYLKLYQQVAA